MSLLYKIKQPQFFINLASFLIAIIDISSIFSLEELVEAKSSIKFSLSLWTAALGKNLTTDNLRKRRLVVVDWCRLCRRENLHYLGCIGSCRKVLWNSYKLERQVGLLCQAISNLWQGVDLEWNFSRVDGAVIILWQCAILSYSVFAVRRRQVCWILCNPLMGDTLLACQFHKSRAGLGVGVFVKFHGCVYGVPV